MPQSDGQLWIRLWKHHKVTGQYTVPCHQQSAQEVLLEALPKLDLPQPMWLPRHESDWEQFRLCTFRPEHFVEAVPFEQMTLSYIPAENEQGRPPRRRNPLEDA